MAKFSAATDHALSVIAHFAMAADLSKNVKGMKGFADFWKGQLPAGDKAVLRRFKSLCRIAHIDLVKAMEQEFKGDGR